MVVNPKSLIRKLVSLPPEMWERIEDYRRTKTPIPERTQAVRELIALGLQAAEKPKRK